MSQQNGEHIGPTFGGETVVLLDEMRWKFLESLPNQARERINVREKHFDDRERWWSLYNVIETVTDIVDPVDPFLFRKAAMKTFKLWKWFCSAAEEKASIKSHVICSHY